MPSMPDTDDDDTVFVLEGLSTQWEMASSAE